MPSPSASLATLRPDLAASFMEYDLEANARNFIGHRVLRVMSVALQASPFGKIPIEQLLGNPETRRAPGSNYNRGKWTFTTDSYSTDENGWEEPIDDRQAQIYRHYFDAEMVATKRAFGFVLNNAEKRIADLIFNATTWTGASLTTAITTEWDDLANAVPVTDVEAAVRKVWDNCGLWPNALIINRHVFRNLRNCAQIIDRSKAQGFMDVRAGNITEAQLSAVFDLPHIIVAGGAKNTAKEGQAAVIGKVWSDEYAMVARVCETDDIQEPGIGRIFHYTEDGSEVDGRVETYRDETVRGDIVRVRHDVDEKVLYTECGHLLSNVTT